MKYSLLQVYYKWYNYIEKKSHQMVVNLMIKIVVFIMNSLTVSGKYFSINLNSYKYS